MGKVIKEKKSGGFWYFLRNMGKKHRVSIRDREEDTEVGYVYISSWRVVFALVGLFLVMALAVIALVIYTPVLDRLPGNPGQRSREMLSENIVKLDSLENELNIMMLYGENVRLIMEGKTPVIRTMRGPQVDTVDGMVVPSQADSLLRQQLESLDGRYALVHNAGQSTSGEGRLEFMPPVNGTVAAGFNPSAGMNGVGVTFVESQQVVAAAPGTVVMSMWTPEYDNVIQIQHRNNYITIYKHVSQSLKAVGDRVEAGEAIGLADSGQILFELWSGGRPVDPQLYILF
jgi:hypothetical protein